MSISLEVFEICSAPILVVNYADSRMIIAANQSAMKTYNLTPESLEEKAITDSLLQADDFQSTAWFSQTELRRADLPVPVTTMTGQTKEEDDSSAA